MVADGATLWQLCEGLMGGAKAELGTQVSCGSIFNSEHGPELGCAKRDREKEVILKGDWKINQQDLVILRYRV